MKNPKVLKIDYILAACRVNPPRLDIYFWTLFCLELVKLILEMPPVKRKKKLWKSYFISLNP
jgi:hypothetical protein